MTVVLVMFKEAERRDFPINGSKAILGRRQDCQLRIPTRDISRQHCALLVQDGKLVVKDLGSSNGTFVNGKRIAELQLKPGDQLRLGPVTFVVQIDGAPATPEPPAKPTPANVEPTVASEDEETFDLNEADFDIDDAMAAPDKAPAADDEDDMP